MIRDDILTKFGRKAARFIADAQVGDDLTASVRYLRIDQDTLHAWAARGLLTGPSPGYEDLPWRCAA